MKNAVNQIVNGVRNFFASISQSSKQMSRQIETYVDEQIDERYENMKTGKPREDRKTRERVKFKAGIVFILCLMIILAIPVTFIFSAIKGKLVEYSIKSPNEIMMNLEDKAEIYPDIEEISGSYIPDAAAEKVGAYWQAGGNGTNAILLSDGEFVMSNSIEERVSTANFLQLQYNRSVRDVLKVYTPDMEMFCMLHDPVLFKEASYIAANKYLTLHAMTGYSQWEIFSFYECRIDEIENVSKQIGKTDLYDYLTMKSTYQPSSEPMPAFDGYILVIQATDENSGTSYLIGAKSNEIKS